MFHHSVLDMYHNVGYLLLRGLWTKDAVELERFLGGGRQNLGLWRELKTAIRATVVSTAAEHSNVTAQVLQLTETTA